MRGKKRILIFASVYPPHLTGLSIYVKNLAEGLAQRDHNVTVVTTNFTNDLPKIEYVNGVKIRRLWSLIRISRGWIQPSFPFAALGLIAKHDYISIHTPMLESALVGVYAKMLHKKLYITHHGDLILPRGRIINRFIEFCVFNLFKIAVACAHAVIGLSSDYFESSRYLQVNPWKFREISTLVMIPEPGKAMVEELRIKYKISNYKIIGYFGRFVEEKRADRLLSALPLIGKKIKNIRLLVVGKHHVEYEKFFERCLPLIRSNPDLIIFTGQICNRSAMAALYALCDVITIPSDSDCFPLVQIEAMLCGTPVVATDIPGARVPVQLTRMGELARADDVEDLADKIVRVIQNRDSYRKPREEIEKFFDFSHAIQQYEELFN